MKCKKCKRTVDKNDNFCRYCGYQFVILHDDERVPAPVKMADGRYRGQIMKDGERVLIYGKDEKEYKTRAKLFKAGEYDPRIVEEEKAVVTLRSLIQGYIDESKLSIEPTTVDIYEQILKYRYQDYLDTDIETLDWQAMLNDDMAHYAPYTVKIGWTVIKAVLRSKKLPIPEGIRLPKVTPKPKRWLTHKQIIQLLNSCKGDRIETAVILGLHSLRRGELCALEASDIYDGAIHVNKTIIKVGNKKILRNYAKTEESVRAIPVFVPRLLEILPKEGMAIDYTYGSIAAAINTACRKAGVPEIGCHGLRKSCASLGYHLKLCERSIMDIGGWTDMNMVHEVYIDVSKEDVDDDITKLINYYGFTTNEAEKSSKSLE